MTSEKQQGGNATFVEHVGLKITEASVRATVLPPDGDPIPVEVDTGTATDGDR